MGRAEPPLGSRTPKSAELPPRGAHPAEPPPHRHTWGPLGGIFGPPPQTPTLIFGVPPPSWVTPDVPTHLRDPLPALESQCWGRGALRGGPAPLLRASPTPNLPARPKRVPRGLSLSHAGWGCRGDVREVVTRGDRGRGVPGSEGGFQGVRRGLGRPSPRRRWEFGGREPVATGGFRHRGGARPQWGLPGSQLSHGRSAGRLRLPGGLGVPRVPRGCPGGSLGVPWGCPGGAGETSPELGFKALPAVLLPHPAANRPGGAAPHPQKKKKK